MAQRIRHEKILSILKKQGFATVKELVALLDYSTATVNRDLNELQKQGLVKRSYGGAEATLQKKYPPLPFRYDLMKKEKRHIGKAAAALVEDGDVIFIDASTTASYMGAYLSDKKDVHVITNNMQLAIQLAEDGTRVTVLGGEVSEKPCMLAGNVTVENAMRYRADKMFFSTGGFTADGSISGGSRYHLLHRTMMRGSSRVYFLADEGKKKDRVKELTASFSEISCVISDLEFPEETKSAFPHTEFICVKE